MTVKQKKLRLLYTFVLLGVVFFCLFTLRRVPFSNDIEVMLPHDKELLQVFQFFQESPFADKVLVSFELQGENATDPKALKSAVDLFSKKLNPALITKVDSGIDLESVSQSIYEYVRLSGQMTSPTHLREIDSMVENAVIQKKIEALYHKFLTPVPTMSTEFSMLDPLGIHHHAVLALKKISERSDYKVKPDGPYLLSDDQRAALLVLKTNVSVTNGNRSRDLVEHLDQVVSQMPKNVFTRYISGHLHSISNEQVIKRDILLTVTVASVLFLILFLFLFKDVRALLLFVTPMISVLIAIHVCFWLLGELSAIVLGMGAVISGIAIDYCIHVYVAMQSVQSRDQAMGEVLRPICVGAFTTLGVFSVFLFSTVPGYRELVLFTIISILLSLGIAIVVLPHFLKHSESVLLQKTRTRSFSNFKKPLIIWILFLAGCLSLIPKIHFSSDVRQYDGSEASVFETEERLEKRWGRGDARAMIVVPGKNLDEALDKTSELDAKIAQSVEKDKTSSLTQILLSRVQREKNLVKWNEYWAEGKKERLRVSLLELGHKFSFSEDAFEPFFETLFLSPASISAYEQNVVVQAFKNQFFFSARGVVHLITFIPDDRALFLKIEAKIKEMPEAFIVSKKMFTQLLSKTILSEAFVLSFFIMFILPVLAFIFLRDIKLVLISLAPVITSIISILGILALFGLSLNAASLIAVLVVGGLSIDYGIFMVYQCHFDLKTNTRLAVGLSALTTFLGAVSLVFAKHPVLFAYGTTMVIGISAGYLTAIFVAPSLYNVKWTRKDALAV